jgi:WD40 repeat protein
MSEERVAAPPSPYKGLAPFEDSPADALFFFGREREREIVAANLLAYRLTVLYGASGVGKSSLIGAGVTHRLRRSGEAVVVFNAWSGDPVSSLLGDVQATLGSSDPPVGGLAASLAFWTTTLDRELYLILDQFDEYFLYHEDNGDLERELAEVVTRQGLRVNVLISIRDDMLSRLDRFKTEIPNLFSNFLRLDHLDRRSAREAIVGPLERYNALVPADERVTIEPELVEAVLFESGTEQQRIEAPFLQLVLQRLWEEERSTGSRALSLATLERLGGAEEIVRAHLVEALAGLPEHDRDLAAELFNHLVTPSGTKIAHGLEDLAQYASVSEDEVVPVLAALMDERIVRPVTTPGVADGARYEIFHDVLADTVVAWRSGHRAERELERTRDDARRRHRRLLVLTGAALLAVAVMVGVTVYAFSQRSAARSEARRAHARALAAAALTGLESDPQRSLRQAVEAARLSPSPTIEDTLRGVLLEAHERAVLPEGGPVSTVAFSPTGGRLAAGGADGKVHLYTASGGTVKDVRAGGPIGKVAFSDDGRLLAAVSTNGVLLLDGRNGRLRRTLHQPNAISVGFGGSYVITAGAHGAARIWRRDGRAVAVLRNPGGVSTASLSGNGRLAVTVAKDRAGHSTARVFVAGTGRLLHVLRERGVVAAALSPDGRTVATGSTDNSARLWNARRGRLIHVLPHAGNVIDVEFDGSGSSLATASEDGLGRVWDVTTGGLVSIFPGATQALTSISFDPSDRFVVAGSGDGNAYVFRLRDSQLIAVLAGSTDEVTQVVFGPDGRRVATASLDRTARIWDPGAADQLRLVRRVSRPVTAAFSSHARIVTRPLEESRPPTARSPDGTLQAAARGKTVFVTETATGKVAYVLRHDGPVTDVEFSPKGNLIATTSRDDTARIWFARSGAPFHKLVGAFGDVEAASFSPDGRWLVTAGPYTAILWRVSSGQRLVPGFYLRGHNPKYRSHAAHLTSASFSPDGRRIVTASLDRTVRMYDCEVCGGLDSLLRLAERRLARISPPK